MSVRSHQSSPLCRRLEYIGKNAFPILVAQYFLYYSALFLFVTMVYTPTTDVAIMLYVGSLVGIIWLGGMFDRFRVNRFWTVGLPYLVHRWPGLSHDMNLVAYRFPVLRGTQAALASLFFMGLPRFARPSSPPLRGSTSTTIRPLLPRRIVKGNYNCRPR